MPKEDIAKKIIQETLCEYFEDVLDETLRKECITHFAIKPLPISFDTSLGKVTCDVQLSEMVHLFVQKLDKHSSTLSIDLKEKESIFTEVHSEGDTLLYYFSRWATTYFLSQIREKLARTVDILVEEASQVSLEVVRAKIADGLRSKYDVTPIAKDFRADLESLIKKSAADDRKRTRLALNHVPHLFKGKGRPGGFTERQLKTAIKNRGGRARKVDIANDLSADESSLRRKIKEMGFKNWKDAVSRLHDQKSS
jgi:hypothetical protein